MNYQGRYKGTEIDERLDLAGTALQEHQDISHLATKAELEAEAAVRGEADAAADARLSEIEGKEEGWDNKADTEDIPTKTSELINDSGFLTEHQSLADYRTASEQDVIDATKQSKTDNNLNTSSKEVVGAINENKQRIDNLFNIGRYLAIWNAATGLPTSNPSGYPYPYKAGDYFLVGIIAAEGETNYMPDGSAYTGEASTTPFEDGELKVGDRFFYDGDEWKPLIASYVSNVVDVTLEGVSTLNNGISELHKELFVAEYDTADYDEIIAAYEAGKTCLLKRGGQFLSLFSYDDTVAYFSIASTNGAIIARIYANGNKNLIMAVYEQTSNRESVITPTASNKYPSSKAVADYVVVKTQTPVVTQQTFDIDPNVLTKLGTITEAATITLNAGTAGVVNIYDLIFTAGVTDLNITWPAYIQWLGGSAPTITNGKTYEVSISEGLAVVAEF